RASCVREVTNVIIAVQIKCFPSCMIKAIDFLSLFLDEWDDWRLPRWQLGRDKVGKGVGRHRGEERGMMLVCYLAGSGDRTLKEMYSVPAPNLKFGKWQERPLKVYKCVAKTVLNVCNFGPWSSTWVCTVSPFRD
ncbi:hypothetical protein Tco_1440531, partial [Tanacetum coccineum]